MAWQAMLMSLLRFTIGRVTNFTVGLVVTLSGVRHILSPANSLLGGFVGLPNLVAMLIGFPVLFIGLIYLVSAFSPLKMVQ